MATYIKQRHACLVFFDKFNFQLMHLCSAMSLWHTDVCIYLCIFVSICASVYIQKKMLLLEYALMDFWDTWIQQSSGWGTIGVFRTLGSKVIQGSFGVIVQIRSKRFFVYIILQMLMKLGLRDPWPEVLSGCSGIFDWRSFWGHLGSLLKGQILNSLPQQN